GRAGRGASDRRAARTEAAAGRAAKRATPAGSAGSPCETPVVHEVQPEPTVLQASTTVPRGDSPAGARTRTSRDPGAARTSWVARRVGFPRGGSKRTVARATPPGPRAVTTPWTAHPRGTRSSNVAIPLASVVPRRGGRPISPAHSTSAPA